ncbi:hypothetical protein [Dyadobacter sediminis]|nr:hypothetical protein [Dyadobacter sediminis]
MKRILTEYNEKRPGEELLSAMLCAFALITVYIVFGLITSAI